MASCYLQSKQWYWLSALRKKEGAKVIDEQQIINASDSYRLIAECFDSIEEELKRKNRFSNEKLDILVKSLTSESSNIEVYDTIKLKRARIYNEPDAVERFCSPTNSPFNGYDKEGSFVNLQGTSEGRCNPKHIAYLYAANSVECCIAEINPAIGSIISVADIKVNDELRILNLSKTFAISSKIGSLISGVTDSDVFLYLQNLFSRPHQNDTDYYLTQYITEKIKNSGFDGLSFHSSKYAHKNALGKTEYGYNFVIFNYDKCEAVSSKLYRVETIEYGFREQ